MPPRKEEEWIRPENLRAQERRDIEAVERGSDVSRSDFGAYYRLLKDNKDDWARLHVVMDAGEARRYAEQAAAALTAGGGLPERPSLLDVGCGPGAITDALRRRLGGPALGVDVSESAVRYGRGAYPDCRFEAVGFDERTRLPEDFDLVHAREFYPFTRTADPETHKAYLDVLLRHVKPGGVLLLAALTAEASLAPREAALSDHLEAAGATRFQTTLCASDGLQRWLPLPAARALTAPLRGLLGRPSRRFYLSRKPR